MPLVRTRDKIYFKGTETFTILQLNRVITFPAPMPDTLYEIYWATPALAVNISITSKTVNGFTINLGVGLAMTMTWVAVENIT